MEAIKLIDDAIMEAVTSGKIKYPAGNGCMDMIEISGRLRLEFSDRSEFYPSGVWLSTRPQWHLRVGGTASNPGDKSFPLSNKVSEVLNKLKDEKMLSIEALREDRDAEEVRVIVAAIERCDSRATVN